MTQALASNLEIAKECYTRFERGDIDFIVNELLSPNVVWVEPELPGLPEAGTHKGAKVVRQIVFGTMEKTYGDLKAQPDRFFNAGDTVIATGVFSSSKVPSTGKRLEVPFCHVMQFQNGRINRMENYTNTHAIAQALGL